MHATRKHKIKTILDYERRQMPLRPLGLLRQKAAIYGVRTDRGRRRLVSDLYRALCISIRRWDADILDKTYAVYVEN